jgi:predicted HNH restriction endonuclease
MESEKLVTASEVGIDGKQQIIIALQTIVVNNGVAKMRQIIEAVNSKLKERGLKLSPQGEASLRRSVNSNAVKAGYINQYDQNNPGWRITSKGKNFLIANGKVTKAMILDDKLEMIVKSDLASFREEEEYFEGRKSLRYSSYYERNSKLRARVIALYGTKCQICDFDFQEFYGERGKDFIEVHHLRPVSELKDETQVDPDTDMTVVCSNCHRMIHRKRDEILSIEELSEIIREQKK